MAYRYGEDRQQTLLFPKSVDQYVTEDHPVRAYDAFVDVLDFNELGIDLDDRRVGNSQYDPRSMLKLLLYGYSYGVKSSRKLERETHNNISFIWLMKNLKPDHKTIAEFRRKNKKALRKALKLCARLCLKLDLIDGNTLFIDSTKLWANAGNAHQHRYKWYRKQLKKLDQRIEQLLSECERIDESEAHCGSFVKMRKELSQKRRLKGAVEKALDEFKARGIKTKDGKERMINRVDSDSALMKSPQGTHPSFAVQSVVDDRKGLIVHTDVSYEANDSQQFAQQVQDAEQTLEKDCEMACADAGYSNIEELEKVESEKRTVIVPSQSQVSDKKPAPFSKSKFSYDKEHDCYICPEGHRLIFRRYQDKKGNKRDYRIEDVSICKACRYFGDCTKSSNGRTIVRHRFEDLREKIERRFEQEQIQQIYERRKARVEHPFGYIKKVLGFRQFYLRGRLGAQAETSILATCFNITRMIRLLGGVQGFVAKMGTL